MAIKVTYKEGFPTKKSIRELLKEFGIESINTMDSYAYTHSICWSSDSTNAQMLNFVDHLAEYGIKVTEFREYNSPITGAIKLAKK